MNLMNLKFLKLRLYPKTHLTHLKQKYLKYLFYPKYLKCQKLRLTYPKNQQRPMYHRHRYPHL
jgi:hypothetical protein